VSWIYTWKATADDEGIVTPSGIEDVPMFWSVLDVTPENLAKVAAEPSNYVMTFNEPDRLDQGKSKISEALAVWPSLESLGKFLGAPATAMKTLESLWLDEFMYQVTL
jgi:Glycosyl hydrolase catalytic core